MCLLLVKGTRGAAVAEGGGCCGGLKSVVRHSVLSVRACREMDGHGAALCPLHLQSVE